MWLVILFLIRAISYNSRRLPSALFSSSCGEWVVDLISITKCDQEGCNYYSMLWGSKVLCGDTWWPQANRMSVRQRQLWPCISIADNRRVADAVSLDITFPRKKLIVDSKHPLSNRHVMMQPFDLEFLVVVPNNMRWRHDVWLLSSSRSNYKVTYTSEELPGFLPFIKMQAYFPDIAMCGFLTDIEGEGCHTLS